MPIKIKLLFLLVSMSRDSLFSRFFSELAESPNIIPVLVGLGGGGGKYPRIYFSAKKNNLKQMAGETYKLVKKI